MNASPPILQIHLLLNVLNRFAFTPGLGEREQAGLECLGDYLVAVHRLQSARASAVDTLQAAVTALLALNQWLREDVAPTVAVRCVDVPHDQLRPIVGLLAARVQAALMLLDGRPIREVDIELRRLPARLADAAVAASDAIEGSGIRVALSVSFASSALQSPASQTSTGLRGDGVDWIDVSVGALLGVALRTEFEVFTD